MTAETSPPALDRRSRDARIRELDRQGWSLERIADVVGLTKQRVHQVLATKDPQLALLERELQIDAELADVMAREEALRRRRRALQRAIDRINEERQAAEIDRILGLS